MSDAAAVNTIDALLAVLAIPAEMQQREAIRTVLQLRHDWRAAEQASVIAAILARSPRQQERLRVELTRLLEPVAPPPPEPRDGNVKPDMDPPGSPSKLKRLEGAGIVVAMREAIRAAPKRNFWAVGGFLVVAAVLALLALADKVPPVDIPILQRDWSGARDILIWILGGLMIAVPLGWVIDVALNAGRQLRLKLQRPPARRSAVIVPGAAWFPAESIASGASRQLFTSRQVLAMGRAAPFRRGSLDSPQLDPGRSVRATVAGAVPALRFAPRREPWSVLVLEDLDSGARGWSEAPRAIRDAMANAGLDASIGVFYGIPDRFELENGSRVDLDAMLRNDALLLLVSDGAMLSDTPSGGRALERLGATRRAAWLDEREERFWHPAEVQFSIPGLSAWPATAAGVESALRQLGGERLTPPRAGLLARKVPQGTTPSAQLARGLGDALGWAATCAMVQPIGPGLAELLRARFFSSLAPIAFGRMVTLPGSRLTQSGLRFSQHLVNALRQEFAAGVDLARRDLILRCIRDEIEGKRPEQEGPARDSWSWYRARFLMDQSFGEAVPELLRLQGSALGTAIKRDLRRIRLPDAPAPGDPEDVVRLLHNPEQNDIRGLVRLSKAYQIEPAGTAIEVWRILPGEPDRIALPASGRLAAVSAGAPADKFIAVLLEDDSVVTQGVAGAIPAVTAGHRGGLDSASDSLPLLFALSHDARFVADANGGLSEVRVRDLLAGGREPLSVSRDSWEQPSRMQGPVTAVAWSPVAPVLLFTSGNGGVAIVEFSSPGPSIAWSDLGSYFTAAGFSTDGTAAVLAERGGKAVIRAYPAFSDADHEHTLETGLDHVEAVALGVKKMAAAGDCRLAIIGRDGANVGTWRLPAGRVDAMALVDQESAVAVLVRDQLLVIQATTGVELLVSDAEAVRGRKHAAIGIERQLALLWSSDRRQIDVHVMDRDEALLSAAAAE